MFCKKATKIGETFTGDLILCSKCQIDGEDFFSFGGLFRKNELYSKKRTSKYLEIASLNIFYLGEVLCQTKCSR